MKRTIVKRAIVVRLLAVLCGGMICGGLARAGDGKGVEVTLDGLKSLTPSSWKSQKPANKLRTFQFLLPRAEGDGQDAELVIFLFPGGGGGVAENIKRWKAQFVPPEGKSIDDVAKLDKFKVGNVEVTYLDIEGTYLSKNPPFDPNAKTVRLDNYRRCSVIFASENGPYFITLTGPAKTVGKHKKGFDDWLKAFK